MILLELIEEALVKIDLESKDKEEMFEELLDVLVRAGKIKDRRVALDALWEREEKGSTDIGKGVAIPHAKTDAVDDLVIAVGVSKDGIDYESGQDEPVHVVFLMLATENNPGLHIEALANIATLVETPGLYQKLVGAETAKDVIAILVAEAKARMND
ncbi:MAG: PTS sugar transporter subunit IIA [Planctomycetes bacterium]|nr:PTS sugar transporter subunit IIA [Planctomycetota bacterium]